MIDVIQYYVLTSSKNASRKHRASLLDIRPRNRTTKTRTPIPGYSFDLIASVVKPLETKLQRTMEHEKMDTGSEQVEIVKQDGGQNGAVPVMPASLAALSQDEYNRLSRKATWKMDIIIMPVLTIMYILNYLDRQNIASAKLANIEEELSLSPVEYQTAVR